MMQDPLFDTVMKRLRSLSDGEAVKGMARFGIRPAHALGISMPTLRGIAREIGSNTALADCLWASGIHEARILAALVHHPTDMTAGKMERWVKEFDSWDVCDQCCSNLFEKTVYACRKAVEWSAREEEFVKRAGFVLMARLAVSHKSTGDEHFRGFFPLIDRESVDERNYVKKAVSWALRQIGKRSLALNGQAIKVAADIARIDSPAARWVAADALRELRGEAVRKRLRRIKKK